MEIAYRYCEMKTMQTTQAAGRGRQIKEIFMRKAQQWRCTTNSAATADCESGGTEKISTTFQKIALLCDKICCTKCVIPSNV